LQFFLEDIQGSNAPFYFNTEIACVEKARAVKYMYSNLLTLMTNRMLKLLF
jgi:hypothetical protein